MERRRERTKERTLVRVSKRDNKPPNIIGVGRGESWVYFTREYCLFFSQRKERKKRYLSAIRKGVEKKRKKSCFSTTKGRKGILHRYRERKSTFQIHNPVRGGGKVLLKKEK